MKIWLITDTHFNHKNMVELQYRPVDFDRVIVDNWKRLVSEDDIVIHLGDVIMGQKGTLGDIIKELPGHKVLVTGNHDEKPGWFLKKGFDFACHAFELNHIYFTHEPAEVLPPNCAHNVHGHTHGNGHRDNEYTKQPWHIEFHIEDDLSPKLLEEVLNESIN